MRNLTQCDIAIAWLNLKCEVNQYNGWGIQKKPLLQPINGHFKWNTLNGIMGPSGAGKTTYLNCLSGNEHCGHMEKFTIYLDNKQSKHIKSCLIEQQIHESIIGRLTVKQILRYAYKFKNSDGKAKLMDDRIQLVIQEMMLTEEILDRHFEKCSGGEQKRIAIAQELVASPKPNFLFIDEPTSGLDSEAAFVMMKCLKQLALSQHMTIITSIHVPNDQTLALFDKLYLLARGGVCIYSGPPCKLENYLKDKIQLTIKDSEKPIEVAIKLACKGLENAQVITLANDTLTKEFNKVCTQLPHLSVQQKGLSTKTKAFSFRDLTWQIQRHSRITFIAGYRSFLLQLLFYIVNLLVFSSIFDHSMVQPSGCSLLTELNSTCHEERSDKLLITENINYLCFFRIFQCFLVMCSSTAAFCSLAKVFRCEHRNKWYSLGVFYWSICLVSIVELTIFVCAITSVGYFASEQHAVDHYQINWFRFAHFTASFWLYYIYMQSLGQLVGVLWMDSLELGIVIGTVIIPIFNIFDDFFFKTDDINVPLFAQISDILGIKHLTRYMLYAIYGIDRCQAETQFSWLLAKHYVDPKTILSYVFRVAINAFILRLITLTVMYLKFNSIFNKLLNQVLVKQKKQMFNGEHPPLELIDQTCIVKLDVNSNEIVPIKHFVLSSSEQVNPITLHKTALAWRDLTLYSSSSIYEFNSSRSKKAILRNLNGQVTFGTVTALMGMSGAGKTSLLRVLNGQCKTRLDSANTCFFVSNVEPIRTCFITQEVSNHLMPGLTARQMLIYASRLKNQSKSPTDHQKIADNLLYELGLTDTCNTLVQNCSGGERKRLALALELTSMQMPNLVCIDEPTSGLDSNSAQIIVSTLCNISKRHNLAIVATIHQPSTDLLSMFDQLYVLARGGVCVYSGPPSQIRSHLSSISQIDQTESKYPIELLIKYSCSDYQHQIVQKLVQINNCSFAQSEHFNVDTRSLLKSSVGMHPVRFSLHSVSILTLRYLAYIQGYLWKQMFTFISLYFFYGGTLILFFDSKIAQASGCISLEEDLNSTCSESHKSDSIALENNLKYTLFSNNLFIVIVIMQAAFTFYYDLRFFFNEHRNGWYSSGSFYLTKAIFEILPMLPVLFVYIYICNIYEAIVPGIYWNLSFIFILAVIASQGMAHILVLLANDSMIALFVLSVCTFMSSILLSNVPISLNRMHYVYQFIANLSFTRFSLEASLILQYGFSRCTTQQYQALLYWMGLTDDHYYHCIGMLVFNIIFYRAMALFLLIRRANPVENQLRHDKAIQTSKQIIPGISNGSPELHIKLLGI